MVKQTKTFKKGNVTKKALSAILAASMVMTSSSFVMAAPVVEEVPTQETVVLEEGAEVNEEQVGAVVATLAFEKDTKIDFSSATLDDSSSTTPWNSIQNLNVNRTKIVAAGTETIQSRTLAQYLDDANNGFYTITVTDKDKKVTEISNAADMPTKAGTYTLTIAGTDNEVLDGEGEKVATGVAEGTFTIKHNIANENKPEVSFENGSTVEYTGQALKPTVVVKDKKKNELVAGTDYDVIEYGNNTNVGGATGEDAPYAEIQFKGAYEERGVERLPFEITAINLANAKVTVVNKDAVYNGKVQKPELKVEYTPAGTTTPITISEKDYTITVEGTRVGAVTNGDTKEADTYTITLTGQNNCSGTKEARYTIAKKAFNKENISVTVSDVAFSTEKTYPADVVVKDVVSDQVLTPGADYTVLYEEDGVYSTTVPTVSKAGTEIAIKILPDKDNYTGNGILASYKVVDLKDTLPNYIIKYKPTLSGATNVFAYDKDGVVPTTVEINGVTYHADGTAPSGTATTEHGRFDVIFPAAKDCKGVGTYEIKVVGKGEWAGQEATIPYKVVAKDVGEDSSITNDCITLSNSNTKLYKTNSKDVTFAINDGVLVDKDGTTSTADDYALVKDVDYTTSITKKGDSYEVVVEYKGNYTGKSKVTISSINSNGLALNSDAIKATVNGTFVYNGAQHKPNVNDIVLTEDGRDTPLVPGIDYEIDKTYGLNGYLNNINVGQASVKVKARSNDEGAYIGSRIVYFDITANETVKENYVLDTSKLKAAYEAGVANTPNKDIVVKTKSGVVLKENTDYTVKYLRDGKVVDSTVAKQQTGTTTMEITVNATKTVFTVSFRVATSLDKVTVIPTKLDEQKFTGSAVTPEVKLVKKNTEIALVEGKDYTVSYINNINHGTAYATIEGIGDYYGTYTVPFKIAGQAEQSIAVLAAQARDIQSRTLNSKPTVVKFEAGKAPKTDVTYESSNEDVVKVDETGKITYTGLGEATITIKAAETAEYKAAEATMTVKVGLAKPSFTPFSKNNAFTLTSSTVKGAEKFEVEYATKKDFSNSKTKTFTTTSAGKVRQVKVSAGDKKTYYVRVRAISGTTKSAWSATKTVATK